MKIKMKIRGAKKSPQNIFENKKIGEDFIKLLEKHITTDNYNPTHYVSFHNVNKIGINPQTIYNTPVGIYAYPINRQLINQIKTGNVPFASNAKYVSVLKAREGVNMLTINSEDLGLRTWVKLLSQETVGKFNLEGTKFEEEVKAIEARALELKGDRFPEWTAIWQEKLSPTYWTADKKRKRKNDFAHIWLATRMVAQENPAKWNGILRHIGFDGALDVGQGIIHVKEKQQAVFFSKAAIEIVKTVPNKFKKREVRGWARN